MPPGNSNPPPLCWPVPLFLTTLPPPGRALAGDPLPRVHIGQRGSHGGVVLQRIAAMMAHLGGSGLEVALQAFGVHLPACIEDRPGRIVECAGVDDPRLIQGGGDQPEAGCHAILAQIRRQPHESVERPGHLRDGCGRGRRALPRPRAKSRLRREQQGQGTRRESGPWTNEPGDAGSHGGHRRISGRVGSDGAATRGASGSAVEDRGRRPPCSNAHPPRWTSRPRSDAGERPDVEKVVTLHLDHV